MVRWQLLALAVLLQTAARPGGRGGAGAARYADYSAARMPQYDSVNYDAQVASSADEGYRDRSEDFPAPVDYNYEQTNDKRNVNEENSWQRDNSGTESTHAVTDYEDSDYSNQNMGDTFIRNKYSNKNLAIARDKRIRSKIKEDKIFAPRSKLQRPNSYEQSAFDDEEVEVSSERGKDLDTDSEKGKFVRRDIRQNVRDKAREHKAAARSSNEYRDQSDYRPGKSEMNADSRQYSEEESPLVAPHRQMGDGRPNRLPPRLPAYRASDDKDQSPNQLAARYRAPMPKPKKTLNDYVDYNDKSRIEKIKSLSARSSTGDEPSTPADGSVAERGLQAALERKEVAATDAVVPAAASGIVPVAAPGALPGPGPGEPLPTLKPKSVDAKQEAHWAEFITNNNQSTRNHLSSYVYLFTYALLFTSI